MQKSLVFPRVNGIQSGLFEQDLETILTDKTVNNVQGIHVPKVDTVDELNYIDYFITKLEKNLGVQKTL
jgi:citrate lyase beta subunit